MLTEVPVTWDTSLSQGTKTFTPGDKWSNDFDYVGMLEAGSVATLDVGLETLNKLYDSFEDVNYHREAGDLGNAIDWATDEGLDNPRAEQFMKMFNKACLKTLDGIRRK